MTTESVSQNEVSAIKFGHFKENLFTHQPNIMLSHFHPHLDVILSTVQAANNDIDTDILAKIQVAFQNFLESGQATALTVGLIFGYVIRGMTK